MLVVHRRFWLAPSGGMCVRTSGSPAFRQRVAGLHAEPVRGHRRVIASAGLEHLIVTLPAGGDSRLPGGLTRGPPRRSDVSRSLPPGRSPSMAEAGKDARDGRPRLQNLCGGNRDHGSLATVSSDDLVHRAVVTLRGRCTVW